MVVEEEDPIFKTCLRILGNLLGSAFTDFWQRDSVSVDDDATCILLFSKYNDLTHKKGLKRNPKQCT